MKNQVDYQRELDQIRQALGYDFMSLALADPAEFDYVIRWKYASGNSNSRYKRIVLQSGRGIAGIVFKTGKPFLLYSVQEQVKQDMLFSYPIINSEKLKSIGAVPLWNDARVAGVLLGGFRGDQQVNDTMLRELQNTARHGIGDLNGKELLLS
ncbi:control of nitrate reduction [Paenibacillus riograndensis]|uniref:Control of nitrate reduction n=1 Tax=Paenibacillus riograndensis TaxID=483937 RepID=A0A132U4N1_9BACL|nr:GAF domain-containing protein [Paenibacillus riograndensis]KWX78544.1 control of nitrate reduction [Paenibacillus riograndensis]KWX86915.1 control of nitrate reduction [Paenibacillus riograndensis]